MLQNHFYNIFAGNQCYPKCPREKVLKCQAEIEKAIKDNPADKYRDFLELVRKKYKICTLSTSDYFRNIYAEPLCIHIYKAEIEKMSKEEKELFEKIEELTLLLIYLNSWREEVIKGEFLTKAWKGYDFNILDSLLDKEYISFSYRAKSLTIRDKGMEKAKNLVRKYKISEKLI